MGKQKRTTSRQNTGETIAPDELKDMQVLSMAYGHPCFRFLLLRELNHIKDAMIKEVSDDPRISIIEQFRDDLAQDTLNSPLPMRHFTSELGNFQLIFSNKNDTLLVAESIDTPPGINYAHDDPVIEFQKKVIPSIMELFTYICNYIHNYAPVFEPETYKSACEILQCDRIIPAVQKREFKYESNGETMIVENYIIGLAFMRETDPEPTIGNICAYLNKLD